VNALYTGLTWDHPRGKEALLEAARLVNASRERPLIRWRTQPLEGFESAPIAALAAENDLLVLDHPHLGEAVAEDCLVPLESLYPEARLARWGEECIGPALESYRFDGRTWALPLDVAAQVMVRRPDLVGEAPRDRDALERLAAERPVALSLGGPHALLTLLSFARESGAVPNGAHFLPDEPMAGALETMHRLYRTRPPGSEALNPIGLLESMARSGEIALVPYVFGYVTYASAGAGREPLAFSDTLGRSGVLGGTGIGFSRRADPSEALLEHVGSLLSVERQCGLIPAHGGQPSFRRAWEDDSVNGVANGFYRDTARTVENALLRPRFDGYIAFQSEASKRLREALAGGEGTSETIAALRELWGRARAEARGALDDERSARPATSRRGTDPTRDEKP